MGLLTSIVFIRRQHHYLNPLGHIRVTPKPGQRYLLRTAAQREVHLKNSTVVSLKNCDV